MISMKTARHSLGLVVGFALGCGEAPIEEPSAAIEEPIIAGADQRTDVFQLAPSPVTRNADGVAIMAFTDGLVAHDGVVDLPTNSLQNHQNACSSVRFASQPVLTAAACTSYLVAPRLVATAGHCTGFAPPGSDMTQFSFVFGFEMLDATTARTTVPAADVYRGRRVHADCGADDCTVIELERPVTNHTMLGLRRAGLPSVGDAVYVLGHPLALPLKFDGPDPLVGVFPEIGAFSAQMLDTAGGNSGSPLFNASTNLVEGTISGRSDSGGISDLEPTPAGCNVEHVAQPEDNLFQVGTLVSEYAASVPLLCSGDANGQVSCGSSGCGVCAELLDTTVFGRYFLNHPSCFLDSACGGTFSACSEACPAPTADDVGPAPVADALLVIGHSSIGTADARVRDRVAELGIPVVVKTASATTAADANGKSVVLISSTVSPSNVGTKFRNVTVPVVVWEAAVFDDMGMTGNRSSIDLGTISSQTRLNVVASGHPLAAGLGGLVTVTTSGSMFSWGKPNGNAGIATLANDSTRAAIFAYEAGAPMVGLAAPARRVGFFLHDTTSQVLTANGTALLQAAVRWATGS